MNTKRMAALVLGMALLGTGVITGQQEQARADGLAYGPDTCISGYVWRAATAADHVCVTPAVRDATALDNSLAAARVNPDGGAYGADTCLDGYVWREAFDGDHVCVTPATRTQAAADNAAAQSRFARNVQVHTPQIWLTSWYPGPVCNGTTCSSTSNDDIPRIKVNGDYFTLNSNVYISFTKIATGARVDHYYVTAPFHTGYALGSFGKRANEFNCANQARRGRGMRRRRPSSTGRACGSVPRRSWQWASSAWPGCGLRRGCGGRRPT
jgi:hypothetical protein